jgi:hypothetical protein
MEKLRYGWSKSFLTRTTTSFFVSRRKVKVSPFKFDWVLAKLSHGETMDYQNIRAGSGYHCAAFDRFLFKNRIQPPGFQATTSKGYNTSRIIQFRKLTKDKEYISAGSLLHHATSPSMVKCTLFAVIFVTTEQDYTFKMHK